MIDLELFPCLDELDGLCIEVCDVAWVEISVEAANALVEMNPGALGRHRGNSVRVVVNSIVLQ